MPSNRMRAYIYLILVAVIWGAAGPVIKYTLEGIDPLPFISYRLAISAVISLIFFLFKARQGKKFRRLRAHLSLALLYGLLAVPISLGVLFFGLKDTTVLDMTLISVIGPMVVLAGGTFFFKDHITKKEKVGIGIVLAGVVVNSFFPIFKSEGIRLTGNLLLLVYLLADSTSILVAKKATRYKIKSANLTNLAFIIGAVTLIPLTAIVYGPQNLISQISNLPLKYHLGVWYMAIFSGTIAYYLFVRAQRTIEVSEAVLFNYLQPVITVPLAIIWLDEKITPAFIFGAILIAGGLFIAEYKKSQGSNPKTIT